MKRIVRVALAVLAVPVILAAAGIAFLAWYCRVPTPAGTKARPLVLYNASIVTMDDDLPAARAVAVRGDRIVYVGDAEGAFRAAGEGAERIDLGGKTLVPGFNDNHTHALAAGSFYSELVLHGKTCGEIARAVKDAAAKAGPGELVSGNSWDYTTCPAPHREMLDRAAPANPVFLTQYSGHAAWVNTAMLKKMKIGKDTPDPRGGQIVRDAKGEPTGILRDTAMGTSEYGKFLGLLASPRAHRKTMEKTLGLMKETGITSIQDNTWEPFTVRLYGALRSEGALTSRVNCWPLGSSGLETLYDALASFPKSDTWIKPGPRKYFADGAFSTRTGWLFEPYADEAKNTGAPRWSDREMDGIVMEAARKNRRLAVHAIGDRAAAQVIDAVEKAAKAYPRVTQLRYRLEHVQIIRPGDISRMKKLGMVAAVQPFALCNPGKDVTLLGADRARRAYPYKSLLKEGIVLSLGSDMPAEVDFRPMLNIYYAVTRKSMDGRQGPLNAGEALTVHEALRAYTLGSAYAEFMEKDKGSVSRGKLADFAVLDRDPFAVPAAALKDIQVVMTVSGGRVVYRR